MSSPGTGDPTRRAEYLGRLRARTPERSPPARLLPWIEDPGSLTERMRKVCGADFRLELLRQQYARPLKPEAFALALPPRRYALVREVLLCRRGTPWIFARSVLPLPTLQGANRRIAHLGIRPLGDILFSSSDLLRGEIKISPLHADLPLFGICANALGREPVGSWLRQSLFRIHKEPLLVSEVFLPEIDTE